LPQLVVVAALALPPPSFPTFAAAVAGGVADKREAQEWEWGCTGKKCSQSVVGEKWWAGLVQEEEGAEVIEEEYGGSAIGAADWGFADLRVLLLVEMVSQ